MTKCIHSEELEDAMERIDAEKLDLEAAKLELKADKLQWKLTRGGSSTICDCKKDLEATKAKLEAERVQLQDEKIKLRLAQIKLKVAQSQLEDAKTELEEARSDLENALNQLETAKAQTDINNMLLEAAKASLEAAKRRFNSATKQLNNAKTKLEDAKTQMEAATTNISVGAKGKCSWLEEENVKLQSEILTLLKTISEMEKDKLKVEAEKKENGMEIQRLKTDNSELKNDKQKLENELKESKAEVERVKSITNKPRVENSKLGNPKVFFDISISGVPAGRIVMELYADTTSRKVEIFRSLCTGEKGVSSSGKSLHYKGTSITFTDSNYWIAGGDITRGNSNEADLIYGGIVPGENSIRKHSGSGDVTMLRGLSSNKGCSFMISTKLNSNLDKDVTCVLIGKVIEGMAVVYAINRVSPNVQDLSLGIVLIENSGQISD